VCALVGVECRRECVGPSRRRWFVALGPTTLPSTRQVLKWAKDRRRAAPAGGALFNGDASSLNQGGPALAAADARQRPRTGARTGARASVGVGGRKQQFAKSVEGAWKGQRGRSMASWPFEPSVCSVRLVYGQNWERFVVPFDGREGRELT